MLMKGCHFVEGAKGQIIVTCGVSLGPSQILCVQSQQ